MQESFQGRVRRLLQTGIRPTANLRYKRVLRVSDDVIGILDHLARIELENKGQTVIVMDDQQQPLFLFTIDYFGRQVFIYYNPDRMHDRIDSDYSPLEYFVEVLRLRNYLVYTEPRLMYTKPSTVTTKSVMRPELH